MHDETSIDWFMLMKIHITYVLEWRTVYALTRGLFWCFCPSCAATRDQITLEWADKQFVTRVHTLFYFSHVITNPYMTIKTTIVTHRLRVSPARFTFCWLRHNRLLTTSQWQDNCNAIRRKVISRFHLRRYLRSVVWKILIRRSHQCMWYCVSYLGKWIPNRVIRPQNIEYYCQI